MGCSITGSWYITAPGSIIDWIFMLVLAGVGGGPATIWMVTIIEAERALTWAAHDGLATAELVGFDRLIAHPNLVESSLPNGLGESDSIRCQSLIPYRYRLKIDFAIPDIFSIPDTFSLSEKPWLRMERI